MPFAEIVREHSHDNPVTAGDDGTLWLLVGTDSGFEGTSTLIWQRIEIELEPQVVASASVGDTRAARTAG